MQVLQAPRFVQKFIDIFQLLKASYKLVQLNVRIQ